MPNISFRSFNFYSRAGDEKRAASLTMAGEDGLSITMQVEVPQDLYDRLDQLAREKSAQLAGKTFHITDAPGETPDRTIQ